MFVSKVCILFLLIFRQIFSFFLSSNAEAEKEGVGNPAERRLQDLVSKLSPDQSAIYEVWTQAGVDLSVDEKLEAAQLISQDVTPPPPKSRVCCLSCLRLKN